MNTLRRVRDAVAEMHYWLPRVRRLTAMAVTRRERWRQMAVFVVWFVASRLGRRPRRTFVMRGRYGILTVSDHSEMLVILEVLVDAAYDDPRLPDGVMRILDLGANIGASALWFARHYPEAEIVSVEADPRTARLARTNVAGHPRIRVLNAAVCDHGGETTLFVDRESWASSTALGAGRGLRVPAVTLDELIGEGGERTLLKLDVEGAEHAALRASRQLAGVEFITGEYHPIPGESYARMLLSLPGFAVEPGADAPDRRGTFIAWRV